jgi:hypothetical protein
MYMDILVGYLDMKEMEQLDGLVGLDKLEMY